MSRLRADGLLLIAAMIWGTAFVAQKNANAMMGPLLFVGARFCLSAFLLAPLAWRETGRSAKPLTKHDLVLAGLTGLSLAIAAVLQQVGLTSTTATHAGFLTALYVALVPFGARMLSGTALNRLVLLACPVSLAGAWLLSDKGTHGLTFGDGLILMSDVAWAMQITLVSKFLARNPRPFCLSFVQYGVTAVVALIAGGLLEPLVWQGIWRAAPQILYAGLLSGGIAFTLQIVAQRHTPAAEAALIMSLESVFAALAGGLLLGDHLTGPAFAGCALILVGVLIVEIPAYQRGSA